MNALANAFDWSARIVGYAAHFVGGLYLFALATEHAINRVVRNFGHTAEILSIYRERQARRKAN